MRTVAAASLGYLLLHLVSLSITIVLFLVLRICGHCAMHIVSSVALPLHFAVAGFVHC